MIAKERNASEHPASTAPTLVAGEAAEKQLAFYLSRAFADAEGVAIFNDLRIVDVNKEVAQIDHLVMHPCGFVLVESKSITGKVRINQQKEWVRVSTRGEEGMPDAVEQARRQRDVLRRFLTRQASDLLQRPTTTYATLGYDVLAAISDAGVIERALAMPKVVKADQVPARLKDIITQRRALADEARAKLGNGQDGGAGTGGVLTRDEFAQMVTFISRSHRPRRPGVASRAARPRPSVRTHLAAPAKPQASPVAKASRMPRTPPATRTSAPATAGERRCPQCADTSMEMRWGTRPKGYYFHCLGCEKNFRPERRDQTCPACRRPDVPLRKSKDVMLLDCPDCGHAGVFHRNP